MAEKKKFEKPEMQVIKLNAMGMLAGSGCGSYECTTDCDLHCWSDSPSD